MILVFDIETFAQQENLSYFDVQYLTEREKNKTTEEVIDSLSLNCFLSHVVSIAFTKINLDNFFGNNNPILNTVSYYLTGENISEEQTEIIYMSNRYSVTLKPFKFDEMRKEEMLIKEREMIQSFWNDIETPDIDFIVSFNGKGFDLPFLIIRSMIHDIDIPDKIFFDNFKLDILEFFSKIMAGKKYSLDFICRHFSLKTPNDLKLAGYLF